MSAARRQMSSLLGAAGSPTRVGQRLSDHPFDPKTFRKQWVMDMVSFAVIFRLKSSMWNHEISSGSYMAF